MMGVGGYALYYNTIWRESASVTNKELRDNGRYLGTGPISTYEEQK